METTCIRLGIKYIQDKDYQKAFQVFDNLLNGDLNNHTSLFKNISRFDNYFNPPVPSRSLV
ncbi:hypothetical protein NQ318_014207 [Aromia moschata]|uniref:Uncharacterized protein n=1 Tax=Aromia moschata TaxID=1265417 RepID=A0AAV8X0P5_9CUCU|nr:hypothetical protein NQ318_014207 [Aromia moschata]